MKIRIGKDINIRWEILTDGEPRPLEGRTLALYIQDYTRRRTEIPFTIAGNALLVSLRAAQLTRLVEYVLTLVENEDEEGQTAVDAKPAFTLVEYSTEEDDSPAAPELAVEQVRLDTANLVRTAGGITTDELFAGTHVVMERGDIVPALRDGQLRAVRVPGTLNGKYKGVIHKAVPLRPKRGIAYIFRNGLLFFKSKQDFFREQYEFLKKDFSGDLDPCVSVFAYFVPKDGIRPRRYALKPEYILEHPELKFYNIIIGLKLHDTRTYALLINSEGFIYWSKSFSYELSTYINQNQIEMASNDYRINHGNILFSGIPIKYVFRTDRLLIFRRKRTTSYRNPETGKHFRIWRKKEWSRVDFNISKTKKIHKHEVLRLFICENNFRSSRSSRFLEITGEELGMYVNS